MSFRRRTCGSAFRADAARTRFAGVARRPAGTRVRSTARAAFRFATTRATWERSRVSAFG